MIRLRSTAPPADSADEAWQRAIARFERSVHRFHEKSADLSDRALRLELDRVGETFDSCLSDLQAARRAGARPGHEAMVVRTTHRAATLCAHATEAAMMAGQRARHREFEDVIRCVDTVRTLTKVVRELVDACMVPS